MSKCENCKEDRPTKNQYIETEKKSLPWCGSCRSNYRRDSRTISAHYKSAIKKTLNEARN